MAENLSNPKRKVRGSESSISDSDARSPEEKRARDRPLKVSPTSESSGDEIFEALEMAQSLSSKIDLILSRIEDVDKKLEPINSAVSNLEHKLSNVQSKVQRLEQDQSKTKETVQGMHEGLEVLNALVEERMAAGEAIKKQCEGTCKELENKLLYAEVYQRRENLRFYGINENEGVKEDTLKVLNEFLEHKWGVQPGEIEFQRVHRVGQTSRDGKPRPIIARFLRFGDRELIFSKSRSLKDTQYGMSVDLPREIVRRRKLQSKKLVEARDSGKLAYFSRAEPGKLFIDRVLQSL